MTEEGFKFTINSRRKRFTEREDLPQRKAVEEKRGDVRKRIEKIQEDSAYKKMIRSFEEVGA